MTTIPCTRQITTLSSATIQADPNAFDAAVQQAIADGVLGSTDPYLWITDPTTGNDTLLGPEALPPAADPTSGLVPMLTDLLQRAQAGEISQLALVFRAPGDGQSYTVWISDTTTAGATLALIGAIANLQYMALMQHNASLPATA